MVVDLATVVTAIAMFLSGGVAVLAAFSVIPLTAAGARPLWPILLTEVAVLATVSGAFWIGGIVLWCFLAVVSWRVSYEAAMVSLARFIADETMLRRTALLVGLVSAAICLVAMRLPLESSVWAAVAGLLVAGAARLALSGRGDTITGALLDVTLFPILPTALLAAGAGRPGNAGFLLLLFLLVETYDSYALLGGKLFGRHPAFPKTSPKKTVEGLIVGLVALALTVAIAASVFVDGLVWIAVLAIVPVALLAIAGDLAASRLKRSAGVKDYPTVLPQQGGLLDMLDAWLMTGGVIIGIMTIARQFGS